MSIVGFSPYGLLSEETGLFALISRYVHEKRGTVVHLCCNGVFSQCDRDGEIGWRRDISHCSHCMAEQSKVAQWAGVPLIELSKSLTTEDISESRRWVSALTSEELSQAQAFGETIYHLCAVSMINRFGTDRPDLLNKSHEQIVRRMILVALRALSAFDRYFEEHKPESAFLVGGRDVLTAAFLSRAQAHAVPLATFMWDVSARAVIVERSSIERRQSGQALRSDTFSCPFVFEDITAMRSDRHTWPHELVIVLDQLLEFLGLDGQQMALPLAR